jgi:hypothetical protein
MALSSSLIIRRTFSLVAGLKTTHQCLRVHHHWTTISPILDQVCAQVVYRCQSASQFDFTSIHLYFSKGSKHIFDMNTSWALMVNVPLSASPASPSTAACITFLLYEGIETVFELCSNGENSSEVVF